MVLDAHKDYLIVNKRYISTVKEKKEDKDVPRARDASASRARVISILVPYSPPALSLLPSSYASRDDSSL